MPSNEENGPDNKNSQGPIKPSLLISGSGGGVLPQSQSNREVKPAAKEETILLPFQRFEQALSDPKSYAEIAKKLFELSHLISSKRKNLLTPRQVENICKRILSEPYIEDKLEGLHVLYEKNADTYEPLIIKRSIDGIERTVYIQKVIIDGQIKFPVWLLPMSKLADEDESGSIVKDKSRKFTGVDKSVTFEYQINPDMPMIRRVSKRIKSSKASAFRNEMSIERIFDPHQTNISMPAYEGRHGPSMRISTAAAICDLEKLTDELLELDAEYHEAMREKANGASEVELLEFSAQLKVKIKLRLANDLMQHMLYVHQHPESVIHQDIKRINILVYLDEQGLIRAKLNDWGQSEATRSTVKGSPLASTEYASPEIAGFSLIQDVSMQYFWDYSRCSYGRDIFLNYLSNHIKILRNGEQVDITDVSPFMDALSYMQNEIENLKEIKLAHESDPSNPPLEPEDQERLEDLETALHQREKALNDALNELPNANHYRHQTENKSNDIFALGVSLFEHLTGCYPTDRPDKVNPDKPAYKYEVDGAKVTVHYMLDKEAFGKYPFLERMLSFKAEDRFKNMAEVMAAWQEYVTKQGIESNLAVGPPASTDHRYQPSRPSFKLR